MNIPIPEGGESVVPEDDQSVEGLKINTPVCPFCSKKIPRVVIVPSGMVNFLLCPECNRVLSVGELRG